MDPDNKVLWQISQYLIPRNQSVEGNVRESQWAGELEINTLRKPGNLKRHNFRKGTISFYGWGLVYREGSKDGH